MQLLNGGFGDCDEDQDKDKDGEGDDSSAPPYVPLSSSVGDDQLFLLTKQMEKQKSRRKKKKPETPGKKVTVLQSIINATVKQTTAHVVPMNERSVEEQDQVTNCNSRAAQIRPPTLRSSCEVL